MNFLHALNPDIFKRQIVNEVSEHSIACVTRKWCQSLNARILRNHVLLIANPNHLTLDVC